MAAAIKPQVQASQHSPAKIQHLPTEEVVDEAPLDSAVHDQRSNLEEMSLAGADREAQSIQIRKMQNYNTQIGKMASNRETERGYAKKDYKSNQDNYVLQSMRSDILQDSI